MMRDGHLSGQHRRTLDAVFAHPEPADLHWLDVVALVSAVGEVEEKHDGKFLFKVGTAQDTFHKPHTKALTQTEVRQLRGFLKAAGVEPGSPEPTAATDSGLDVKDVVVVIDHHETRVFALDGADEAAKLRPYDPHGFLHHLTHKDQPRDRGQRAPEDDQYYDRVVQTVRDAERILVVSHGVGESDAGARLAEHLKAHHGDVYARVVRVANVDTSALTDPQILAMAKEALGKAG